MNTSKKLNNITAISLVIILALTALIATCIVFSGCTVKDSNAPNSSSSVTDGNGNVLDSDKVYDMPEQINFTAAALAANPFGVFIKISATVMPSSAPNKNVDWSVEWAGLNSENVREFITVTPDSDGATSATISCFKAFSTPIAVKVTTREGGFEAVCICTFESQAQSIDVMSSFRNDGERYLIGTSSNGTFTFSLKNVFGNTANYNLSYDYGVEGSLYLGKLTTNTSAKTYAWSEVSLQSLSQYKDKFITSISFENNVLTISTGINDFKTFRSEGYYDNWGGGSYKNLYVGNHGMIANSTSNGADVSSEIAYNSSHVNDCYLWITVTDSVSNLSVKLKLYYSDSVVSGVSLSQSTIKI